MAELDPKAVLASIEVIRAVKSLFVEQNPYLPMYSALGGAFVGAVSSFFPNYIINKLKDRKEKRTPESETFYARLGWHVKERTEYHGCPVTIMEKQIVL